MIDVCIHACVRKSVFLFYTILEPTSHSHVQTYAWDKISKYSKTVSSYYAFHLIDHGHTEYNAHILVSLYGHACVYEAFNIPLCLDTIQISYF